MFLKVCTFLVSSVHETAPPPPRILYCVALGALIQLLQYFIYILQTVSVNKME